MKHSTGLKSKMKHGTGKVTDDNAQLDKYIEEEEKENS